MRRGRACAKNRGGTRPVPSVVLARAL